MKPARVCNKLREVLGVVAFCAGRSISFTDISAPFSVWPTGNLQPPTRAHKPQKCLMHISLTVTAMTIDR